MVRKKLAVMVAALTTMQAGVVSALGVGDFNLKSALNQPLDAEIRLLNASDLDSSQIRVSLATNEDFKRAGVDREYFLNNIKFKVELDENGVGRIRVSTREPVIEPYLNFLIETRWPTGRLLREYTVLLDLPIFSESQVGDVNTAVSIADATKQSPQNNSQQSAQQAISTPTPTPARAAATSSPRQNLAEGELKPGSQYRVRQNETLWEIALKARPAQGISVQQTMVSIQRMNPSAFTNGNINLLKAGYVLRLPTADEAAETADKTAVKEVANQNRQWRSGDTARPVEDVQLDARSDTGSASAEYNNDARLSISSSGDSEGTSAGDGTGTGDGSASLRNELDATSETLDKVSLENNELQNRLNNTEETLATVQRLLELKEDELAALQAELSAKQSQTNDVNTDQSSAQVSLDENTQSAVDALQDESVEEATQKKSTLKSAPSPAKEKSLVDEILGNPLYLGGAGLLLLAVVAVVIMRRRKQEEDALEAVDNDESEEPLADIAFESNDSEESIAETEPDVDDDGTEDLIAQLDEEIAADNAEEAARAELDEPQEESSAMQSETGDVIAEADIYIAYGRYQQAIDLLSTAVEQEPDRSDLQVKLLEVYIETREKEAFQQQYSALQSLGDESAIIEVKEMLSTVDGVSDWLDSGPSEELTTDSSDQSVGGLDLDIGEQEIDLDLGESSSVDAEPELDLNVENLSSDSDAMEFESVALDEGSDEELVLEEDLDLDFDLDEGEETTTDSFMRDDDLLELDDDLSDSNQDEESASEESVDTSDVDLGSDNDLDLDLGDLDDSSLDDLEAEFGELDSDLNAEIDQDLLGESGIESPVDEVVSTATENDINLDEALSQTEDLDLSAGSDDDTVVGLSAISVDALQDDEDETVVNLGGDVDESFSEEVATDASDDEFDFLGDGDEVATKLDLARAYIDMGDTEGAKDILDEVIQEGDDGQKQDAKTLLERVE